MIPLPHITRRQLVFSLVLSVASILFLLTSLILRPTDISSSSSTSSAGLGSGFNIGIGNGLGAVKSSAQGIRQGLTEKIRAFASGYIPDNERPSALAEDESGAGLFDDNELETGLYTQSTDSSESSTGGRGTRWAEGWNSVKNRSTSVWTQFSDKLSSLPHPFSSSSPASSSYYSSAYDRGTTDWDDLPTENLAFKNWEFSRSLLYSGTGARVQRFLEKARRGRGFTVGVVGGSVSKGRGLPGVIWDKERGVYVVGGSNNNASSPSSSSHSTSEPEDPDAEDTHTHEHRQHRRLPSSSFPQDRDPAKTQNLYNPFNLHMQVFEYLDMRFPAMPLGYGDIEGAEKKKKKKKKRRAMSEKQSGRKKREDGEPILDLTSGVDPSHPPPRLRGKNSFINGAQGGVGSDYFAGCWKEHLGEDVDLVIVELGIQEARSLEVMENYELLLRSLLEMDSRPAVINVQTFTLLFSTLSQASSLHIDVAAYYDTPVISLRDVLLPRILNDPTSNPAPGGVLGPAAKVGLEVKKWFRNVPEEERVEGDAKVVDGVDLMHISHHAHSLLAELVVHYLQLQIAQMEDYDLYLEEDDEPGSEDGDDVELTDIPGMLLASAYSPNKKVRRTNPECTSTNSAFEARRLVLPEKSSGWAMHSFGEKRYLVADKPGSRITFPIRTQAKAGRDGRGEGYVKIGHWRSKVLGLGSVACWVDDREEDKTRVDGWWDIKERNMGIVTTIRDDLLPGNHTLTCEVLEETLDEKGGTEFRLISVLTD